MGDVVPFVVRRTEHAREPAPDLQGGTGVEALWRESVGRQLREERLARRRRLVDVAGDAGVSPQYLSEVERGLKDPSSELLAAMAGALGLSIADLASRVASAEMSSHAPLCMAG
jgi:DNA-binding XRE family transcriptional regulator